LHGYSLGQPYYGKMNFLFHLYDIRCKYVTLSPGEQHGLISGTYLKG